MNIRLVRTIEDRLVAQEFDEKFILNHMAQLGYEYAGRTKIGGHLRTELEDQPRFTGLCGPMWDGDAIRYEDQATNEYLSK